VIEGTKLMAGGGADAEYLRVSAIQEQIAKDQRAYESTVYKPPPSYPVAQSSDDGPSDGVVAFVVFLAFAGGIALLYTIFVLLT
jgi:hypothetical protein